MSNDAHYVMVTGASGFVGRHLCSKLVVDGWQVRAVLRNLAKSLKSTDSVTISQLDGQTSWAEALQDVDVVIHLAALVHVRSDFSSNSLSVFRKVNVSGTLHLASQAAKAGVKRFIYISSIKVNGELTMLERPFTESDIANPQDAYSMSKFEAEQGLLLLAKETDMEIVIIRPPLVYGVGVKANFANIMRALQRGIPLPFGAIANKRSFVYVGNLVSLITCCINHPAAANQVFLVSDNYDLSTTELLHVCAMALGVRARLLPVPKKIIELFASLVGCRRLARRLCGSLQVDIRKAHSLLGWTPPYSVVDGLKETATGILRSDTE